MRTSAPTTQSKDSTRSQDTLPLVPTVKTSPEKKLQPFRTLDIFRGFAALWVVMDHSCDRWLFDGHLSYASSPLYAFSMRGQWGVMLFFAISGYCIVAAAYACLISGKSVQRYCYERLRRIYPPYLVTLVISALCFALIGYANSHHWISTVHHLQVMEPTFNYWIGNVFLLQFELNSKFINLVFWSLCYEMTFYLFVGILLAVAKWVASRKDLATGTGFLVCAVSVSTLLTLLLKVATGRDFFPFDLWHQFSIGGLLFFLLDVKPNPLNRYTPQLRKLIVVSVLVAFIAAATTSAFRLQESVSVGQRPYGLWTAIGLGFCVVLMILKPHDEAIAAYLLPLTWLGGFSYSLYLTHPIILPFVDILTRRAGLDGPYYWISFWLQVGSAIVFGRIFYLVIERKFISKRQVLRLESERIL